MRSDATVSLEPITPLKDMQITLDPGTTRRRSSPTAPRSRRRRRRARFRSRPCSSSLDGDTRAFLGSLIASVDQGTRGRGDDMRKAFRALGPTTAQVGEITRPLASRREEISRLVHNLAKVTRAASRDDQLTTVVTAGDATLAAIAREEKPLRESLARLPDTLDVTRSTLQHVGAFSDKLGPTLTDLLPAVRRLPETMEQLGPFSREASAALRDQIRPLVRAARPAARNLGPGIPQLTKALPDFYDSFQSLRYLMNVTAYNPPGEAIGQPDEGNLFWLSWFLHNMSSTFSGGEAHGGTARASIFVNCQQIAHLLDYGALLKLVTGTANLCPGQTMETQTPTWRQLVLPAGSRRSAACCSITWLTFGGSIPLKAHGYRATVVVPQATNLNPGADIQVAGVKIGRSSRSGGRQRRQAHARARATSSRRCTGRDGDRADQDASRRGLPRGGARDARAPAIPDGGAIAGSATSRPTSSSTRCCETFSRRPARTCAAVRAGWRRRSATPRPRCRGAIGNAAPATANVATCSTTLDAQRPELQRLLAGSGDVLTRSAPGRARCRPRSGPATASSTRPRGATASWRRRSPHSRRSCAACATRRT